ncbi:MAG: DUF885 domain-containing protein, partial [Candidatus Marinimicrobia bacterium]|nr:DUF885 domain-containing protein [Candidatus Neomarinimicrobiota bacterium]
MRITPIILSSLALFLSYACELSPDEAAAKLHQLFEDQWEKSLKEHPERATYLGDDRYNDRLTDMSMKAVDQRHKESQSLMKKLEKIPREKLNASDKLNYDLYHKQLKRGLDGFQFKGYLMPIDQMGGVQINAPNLVNITPFRNKQDFDNYLKRLEAFPIYMDQIIALMEEGLDEDMIQPGIILRSVPDQIKAQYEIEVDDSPFFKPFNDKLSAIPDTLQETYAAWGREAVEKHIFTSFRKLDEFFSEEYLPGAREEIGAMHFPNGESFYAFQIRNYTTTEKSAEEIHRIGLNEVLRIRNEMDEVITESGFQGRFKQFVEYLRTNPDFYFSSADELLEGYRAICKQADPELVKLFGVLPRMPYGVKPIPDYQAPASPTAYYYSGSKEGGRPGYFWANTYKIETRPKYEMEALSLHEAVPGHHLQISLAQELENVPEFRKHGGFTAFTEGWGLYAEKLGEEMGFYQDPYSKFGQLTYEMWRACRLVVDTGMHALGWPREKAIQFMLDNTAKTENDVTVEIDRYIAWPGQSLAYKIGELKLKELKAMAKSELGDGFNVRGFHDAILGNGALP